MSTKNTTTKLHNPKSYAPAVYIPCWLIQIPHNELSYGAKLLYGRLAQWSNTSGKVFRSCPQLSKEMGMGERTIERFISELKNCKLIGTFQPQAGGLNHFEFYDHEWMYQELTSELGYEDNYPPPQSYGTPPPHLAVPPASPGGTPPPHLAGINIKEIEINNKQYISCENVDSFDHEQQKNTPAKNDTGVQSQHTPAKNAVDKTQQLIAQDDYQRTTSNKRNKNTITPNQYQETLYPLTTSKSSKLSNTALEQTNPHQIPAQMIQDWVETRKAKKSPVTPTVWNRLNKELSKCPNPIEAFEEMVCRGWLSFKSEWLQKGSHLASEQPFFDNKSTSWIDKLEQDVF